MGFKLKFTFLQY